MKREQFYLTKAIKDKKEKRAIEREEELNKEEKERLASLPENVAKRVLNAIDSQLEDRMFQAMENLSKQINKKSWENKFEEIISFYLTNELSDETEKIIIANLAPKVDKFIPKTIKDDIKVNIEYEKEDVYDDSDPNDFGFDSQKIDTNYFINITLSIEFE